MDQTPSIGRIVIYTVDPFIDPPHNNATHLPAMVVRVWSDTCLNLKVINDGNVDFWVTSATRGDQVQQWNWPPRV